MSKASKLQHRRLLLTSWRRAHEQHSVGAHVCSHHLGLAFLATLLKHIRNKSTQRRTSQVATGEGHRKTTWLLGSISKEKGSQMERLRSPCKAAV